MIRLLLFLLLAGALAAYSFWIYLRAELPVRSGRLLAALRTATLLLLLALLFDPRLPWGGAGGSAAGSGASVVYRPLAGCGNCSRTCARSIGPTW